MTDYSQVTLKDIQCQNTVTEQEMMQQPGLLGLHKIPPFSFHIHPTHTFSFIKQLPWVQVLIGLPNPTVMLLRTLVMNKRQREQDQNDSGGLIQGRQRAAKVKEGSQEIAMS